MNSLFEAPLSIFTIVGGTVLGICMIEIILFLLGASLSRLFDHGFDTHIDHNFDIDHDINLLNFGQVPLFVILLCLGTFFSLTGIGIHTLADSFGEHLSNLAVVPASVFSTTFLTYWVTRAWSKFFPNEESYAIGLDELLGHTGDVHLGRATGLQSVEVAVKDRFGSTHYIMTRCAIEGLTIKEGDAVVLVDKLEDGTFLGIPALTDTEQHLLEKEA